MVDESVDPPTMMQRKPSCSAISSLMPRFSCPQTAASTATKHMSVLLAMRSRALPKRSKTQWFGRSARDAFIRLAQQ
jgi:hypothetical protein